MALKAMLLTSDTCQCSALEAPARTTRIFRHHLRASRLQFFLEDLNSNYLHHKIFEKQNN
jgi:hypothetical protein